MKIYEFTGAPNPRRVRVFLAEKGINNVPSVQVNIATGENRKPEFLKINPMGGLPVLELDDGTHIAESVAICRYFEEIHPEPRLMGIDAKDEAIVEMWNRRMELGVLSMTAASFRNTSDFFKGRIPQVKEYGEVARNAAVKALEWLERAARMHDLDLVYLKVEADLDPLRNEPRFQTIERELKFPP